MSGGDELVVVDTPLGPTGLATCYDMRFPELFRALTEGGATAVLLTSGWPTPRIEHWDVLTRARAIENQTWFIACNEVGVQPARSLLAVTRWWWIPRAPSWRRPDPMRRC